MSWKEFEITNFKGMATNIAQPDKSQSILSRNLDIHEKPGILTLRPGYTLKYALPSDTRITNGEIVSFDNFFEQTATDGEEITVLIENGTVVSEEAIVDTQTQPNFWVRPSWNGSAWVDSWEWLNEVVITKVKTASDATFKSYIEITDEKVQGYYVGWTMWNKTQNIVSQVITSFDFAGGNRINHSYYDSNYLVDDIIYLFKNYVDPVFLAEMFNATSKEIVYHKILNDIRIGFGGKISRVGLSIGFRDKYFKIKEFDFTNVHSDITEAALTAFSHINGLILDEYSFVSRPYGMELSEATGGALANGTYHFRLTGLLDDNSELLLAENFITTIAGHSVEILPYTSLGKHNKRLTDFKMYYSADGTVYNLLKRYTVTEAEFSPYDFVVNEQSRLILNQLAVSFEMPASATSPQDINSIGEWQESGLMTLSSFMASPIGGVYSLQVDVLAGAKGWISDNLIQDVEVGETYNVDLYTKETSAAALTLYFANSSDLTEPLSTTLALSTSSSWAQTSGSIVAASSDVDVLVIAIGATGPANTINVDEVDITIGTESDLSDTTVPGAEISAEMGYTPSFNLVKDWEQCLVFNGRGHYLNPFVEKEYDNFIMLSAISAGNMYDAVTSGQFLELDKFDGSKTLGMALLPNADLLILKDQSTMIIDPDTNFTRDFGRGKGCIARESIVTLANAIIWCGLEDIYTISPNSGLTVVGLLDDTIRDLYLADTDLINVIAVRDKYNTYRFRQNNETTKAEYLLTDRGWIEQVKALFVEMYRVGFDNRVWFMNAGNLYIVDAASTIPISSNWEDIADNWEDVTTNWENT